MKLTLRTLEHKIEALEAIYRQEPMYVEAENPKSGVIQVMPVTEMIKKNWGFCRVVSGCNYKDFDMILDRFQRIAFQAVDTDAQIIDETT